MVHLAGDDKSTLYISKAHLSDHPTLVDHIASMYPDGSTITDVLVFSKDSKTQRITLTLKQSLKSALADVITPKSIAELSIDALYAGFVSSITTFGCFVTLPHGLIGVADKSHLSSKFVNSPSEIFQIGQSVLTQLSKVGQICIHICCFLLQPNAIELRYASAYLRPRRLTWTNRASTSISTRTSSPSSPTLRLSLRSLCQIFVPNSSDVLAVILQRTRQDCEAATKYKEGKRRIDLFTVFHILSAAKNHRWVDCASDCQVDSRLRCRRQGKILVCDRQPFLIHLSLKMTLMVW